MSGESINQALKNLERFQSEYKGSQSSWSDDYFLQHESYYGGIMSLVEEHLSGRLLEVGSAPYHLTFLLKETGYDVVGLDLEPGRMQELIDELELDVKECNIERERFPFEDDSFGSVVFTEVLEHLRINPIWTLEEINRVLKPDGRLLLTTPNLLSIYNLHSLLTTGKITDPYYEFNKLEEVGHMGHVREYTAWEVTSLLEKTGFKQKSRAYANWPSKGLRSRSILHNLGIGVSALIPLFRKFQIQIATPR